MARPSWHVVHLALLAFIFAATGCRPVAPTKENELVVFAAASLREAFSSLGRAFERAHPGVRVTFNFAGTQELRTQLEHGASADIFASADERHMQALVRVSRVATPRVFARNEPVVIVSREASATVRRFEDLPLARRIVFGTPEVPIGRYTLAILERAGPRFGADFRTSVESRVVSRELNVRQVLMKVILGEGHAGVVYRTDAHTARDRLTVVAIPAAVNVIADYPIAELVDGPHPRLARAWIELVCSREGQRVFRAEGFLPAEACAP